MILFSSKVIFGDPPKMPFKTSMKITFLRLFLFIFEVIYFFAREVISKQKEPQKILRVWALWLLDFAK